MRSFASARVAVATLLAGVSSLAGGDRLRADQLAELVVPAVHAEADAIALPSVAAAFGSFDEVSDAVRADRERIATLEKRLAELERSGPPAPESLPTPEPAGGKDGEAAKKPDKPAEPYEVGSDKKTATSWADGFQAQSANKDFPASRPTKADSIPDWPTPSTSAARGSASKGGCTNSTTGPASTTSRIRSTSTTPCFPRNAIPARSRP
jgi:hypothetical protein